MNPAAMLRKLCCLISVLVCMPSHAQITTTSTPPPPGTPLPASMPRPHMPRAPEVIRDSGPGALTIVAGMVVRNELCQNTYPELGPLLNAAFLAWKQRNQNVYDTAINSPHYARTVDSARTSYQQNNITLSEADCRAQLARMGGPPS